MNGPLEPCYEEVNNFAQNPQAVERANNIEESTASLASGGVLSKVPVLAPVALGDVVAHVGLIAIGENHNAGAALEADGKFAVCAVGEGASHVTHEVTDWGRNAFNSVEEGASHTAHEVSDWGRNVFNSAVDEYHSVLGSPADQSAHAQQQAQSIGDSLKGNIAAVDATRSTVPPIETTPHPALAQHIDRDTHGFSSHPHYVETLITAPPPSAFHDAPAHAHDTPSHAAPAHHDAPGHAASGHDASAPGH